LIIFNIVLPIKEQRNFVDKGKIEKYLTCTICHDIFDDPLRISCGHTFCSNCVSEMEKKTRNQICVICKQRYYGIYSGKDLIAQSIINDAIVRCIYKGCPWKDKLADLYNHIQNCLFDPSNPNYSKFVNFIQKEKGIPLEEKDLPIKEKVLPIKEKVLPIKENFLPVKENILPVKEKVLPIKEKVSPIKERSLPIEEKKNNDETKDNKAKPVENSSFNPKSSLRERLLARNPTLVQSTFHSEENKDKKVNKFQSEIKANSRISNKQGNVGLNNKNRTQNILNNNKSSSNLSEVYFKVAQEDSNKKNETITQSILNNSFLNKKRFNII